MLKLNLNQTRKSFLLYYNIFPFEKLQIFILLLDFLSLVIIYKCYEFLIGAQPAWQTFKQEGEGKWEAQSAIGGERRGAPLKTLLFSPFRLLIKYAKSLKLRNVWLSKWSNQNRPALCLYGLLYVLRALPNWQTFSKYEATNRTEYAAPNSTIKIYLYITEVVRVGFWHFVEYAAFNFNLLAWADGVMGRLHLLPLASLLLYIYLSLQTPISWRS